MRASLDSYRLLLLWQFRRCRQLFVMTVVIQVVLGMGIVYGLAFLIPNIDPRTALFLSTGELSRVMVHPILQADDA